MPKPVPNSMSAPTPIRLWRLSSLPTVLAAALVSALALGCAQTPTQPGATARPATAAQASGAVPVGEVSGSASAHTPESAREAIQTAQVVLPASVTGAGVFRGVWRDIPANLRGRAPVVVFMHGSSGLGLAAIGEWQVWLASLGIASVAPNSFAVPNRLTYKSPVPKEVYERVHALRSSEVPLAVQALAAAPWADASRMVLAGTSEGATAVARHRGAEFAGRVMFAWSCEDNYFVQSHQTALPADRPVLNLISSTDPFFSASNSWVGNPNPVGHCGPALQAHTRASVVLIPGAPHTILNLPAARHPVEGFLKEVLRP